MYILISFYGFTTPWIQIHCKSKCKKIIRPIPCYLGRLNVFHYLNAKANNLPSCNTKLMWPYNCLLWSRRTWFLVEQWKLPLGMCVEIFENKTNCFAFYISCECSPKSQVSVLLTNYITLKTLISHWPRALFFGQFMNALFDYLECG